MDELTLHEYGSMEFDNAVAIIGFPSIGLISSIATSFLAKELDMSLVAGITSSAFPPYAIVQNGVPMPPVRIYGCTRTNECGVDCDSIIVLTSEFIPKPESFMDLADLIVQWCRRNNVHTMITLDGIVQFNPDSYNIIGVGSTDKARRMMEELGIESFNDGLVRGLSGMILLKAANEDFDAISLLGSARQDAPDPRGAAKIMEALSKILPELKIDLEPLYTEAEELEKKMLRQNSQSYDNRDIYG